MPLYPLLRRVQQRLPDGLRERLSGTPIARLYDWLQIRTADLTTVTYTTPAGDIALLAPVGSSFANVERKGGVHEPPLTEAVVESIDADDVFYDVGSLYGYYAALARKCGVPPSQVYAFEANRFHAHVLRRNHADAAAAVEHAFVGDGSDGTISIDAYAAEHEPPTAAKIDVEGAEMAVLEGMGRTLQEDRPELFIEIHPESLQARGETPQQVFDLLREHGYALAVEADAYHGEGEAQWRELSADAVSQLPSEGEYLIHARPE